MTDYDSPWKEMLDLYFPQFMQFFFPQIHADIDWDRGWEVLDTELQQIVRDAELGKRLADKLFKVWRRDGTEQFVLIHVEVQDKAKPEFPKRMYVYHYRLFDRYDRQVVSLAVLTDPQPAWKPQGYGYELWGCRLQLDFPVVKLRDYRSRMAELETSDNPFAIVTLAHLQSQLTRRKPQARFDGKLALTRRLYERGYSRKDVLELFNFIDWIMELPTGLGEQFRFELERLEAERHMRYVNSIERAIREECRQEGRQEGRLDGRQEGEVLLLQRLLNRRFGPLPEWAAKRLSAASQEQIEIWADRVLDARRLEDVFDER